MTVYCVLLPPGADPVRPTQAAAERVAFVKEGFCWPALFIPVIWLLWHRMWLVLLGYIAVVVAIEIAVVLTGLSSDGAIHGVVAVLFALLFACEANGLRRWTLERRGWRLFGVANGSRRDEAEARFFTAWLGNAAQPPAPPPDRPPRQPAFVPRVGSESVVGLSLGRDGLA